MQRITELLQLDTVFSMPDLNEFLINTLLLILMTEILAYVYRKFGHALSNRRRLAALFPLLAITTMMIISIIRSSIALSLGLVGALSIVRFRSAIKEPEELAYIFLTIALGLGMGAGQREVTLGFYVVTMAFLVLRELVGGRFTLPGLNNHEKMYLEITTDNSENQLKAITDLITPFTSGLELKRVDTSGKKSAYYFLAWVPDYQKLTALTQSIKTAEPTAEISVLNEETLFS